MAYKVMYCSDFEFDNLPYKYVKESLGCANPKTQTAYVRKTGIPVLDMFTTEHEIEELIAKVSPHEEDGIRYKKGGAARSIVPAVLGGLATVLTGGLGAPALLATLAGVGTGAASGYGMGSYAASNHPELGKRAGLWGGVQGGLGALGLGKIFSGALSGFQGAAPGLFSKLGGMTKGALGFNSPTIGAGTKQSPLSEFSGMRGGRQPMDMTGPNPPWSSDELALQRGYQETVEGIAPFGKYGSPSSTYNYGYQTPPVSGQTLSTAGTNFPTLPSFNLGFGSPRVSSEQATQSQTPIPTATQGGVQGGGLDTQSIQGATKGVAEKSLGSKLGEMFFPKQGGYNWGQTIMGGAVPLVGQAFTPKTQQFDPMQSQMFQDVYNRVKQGTTAPLTPAQQQAITANYDKQLESARENIMARWRATRPGSDITNDSQLRDTLSSMEQEYATEKANALTAAQMGMNQQQTEMLSQLASMDVFSLAQAAQISREEAQAFREMLANMGFMISQGGNNSPYAGLANMFNK